MLYRQFYSELAKLLYAIAYSDGKIAKEEKEELRSIVKNELVPAEKHIDKFGTDAASYIEIEFDFLEDTIADPEAAFNSFIDFIERHHTAVTEHMKETALETAKKVAAIYHKTNKKETALIYKLEEKLATLPGRYGQTY